MEWEPLLEALSGTFEAHHVDLGKLIYSGCSAAELAARSIFFFDVEYVVPTSRTDCGSLQAIPPPTLVDLDWPAPLDNVSVPLTSRQIEIDILNV